MQPVNLPDPGSWKTVIVLRLASIFYASLTILFCYLLAKEIIKSRWRGPSRCVFTNKHFDVRFPRGRGKL